MEFIIHPYEGVEIPGKGIIKFGMSREEVRSFFQEEPEEFLASESDDFATDAFVKSSIQFEYRSPDVVTSVLLTRKQDPRILEKKILRTAYIDIENWIKNLDVDYKIEDCIGIKSEKLGIAIYAPGAFEEEEENLDYIAESVLVFEQGYYDK